MQASYSESIMIRGLRYHIRHWGELSAPQLFMLHGWMDVSASFQFVADYLAPRWHLIAPDWRGYGLSETARVDSYWFADYVGDLDAILRHYSPQQAVNLLGHSMGGNVAAIYSGVCPQRVQKLINLEGFGVASARPEQAPKRFARWLDALHQPASMRSYADQAEVIARLCKNNPRLSVEKAQFLSQNWAKPNAQGRWEILADPAHKAPTPVANHEADMLACWAAISAPVLWVEAEQTEMWQWLGGKEAGRAEVDRRLSVIRHLERKMMPDAGHMLHHDQPQLLAQMIEEFLTQKV